MEKDHKIIIILLIVIIAILVMCLGTLVVQNTEKEECILNIDCKDMMNNGDKVKVKLTDLNNTPIANATIHVKLENGNDMTEYNITTNEKGIATLALNDLKDSNYIISCIFDGANHYKPTNSTGKFNYNSAITASSGSSNNINPIDANRPVNNPNYKGYTPRHESEVTSDGWNPREHEVSRENMGDGKQRINYDDGYYCLVDSNGYVITYGYR